MKIYKSLATVHLTPEQASPSVTCDTFTKIAIFKENLSNNLPEYFVMLKSYEGVYLDLVKKGIIVNLHSNYYGTELHSNNMFQGFCEFTS